MFSAQWKPAGASRTDALTQLVSTFKTGVLGSLVGLKLLILRWYQIEATRQREIDFHIPKTLTKAGSPYASHSLFAPARGILANHGRNPVSTARLPTIVAELHLARLRPGPEASEARGLPGYWVANLDGPLYRVRVAHRRLIAPQEFKLHRGRAQIELTGLLRGTLS
jgi:hypothetical protein